MDSKKHLRGLSVLLFLCLALGAPSAAYAQETKSEETVYEEGDFFIAWNDGGPRFIQRLSWNHSELALRYEVILEESLEGKYTELLRQTTRENFLIVSLRPGKYRYQVGVYNLLDQNEYTMDWTAFEVLNALQPKIDSFTPVEFNPDTGDQLVIEVKGQDMDAGADIRLRLHGDAGQGLRPVSREIREKSARLVFNNEQLASGSYDVYIRNPGGLEDTQGTLIVRPQETDPGPAVSEVDEGEPDEGGPDEGEGDEGGPDEGGEPVHSRRPDIIISAEYAPVLPLYGVLFSENAFERPFFPAGAALRAGIIPFKLGKTEGLRHYFGAELGASWNMLEELKEKYKVSAQVWGIRLKVLYQLWFNQSLALNVRLGGGINIIGDFYYDYGKGKDATLLGIYPSLDMGLSFQRRITGTFGIEVGADFSHLLSADDSSQPGYIRPAAGIFWQF
ncbi:hypothetical protein FACS1894106_1730 [Spirochaetia bacterium]|nr:hypothetical protein FACS1894106_1730 [Spirochaetia bacterium]